MNRGPGDLHTMLERLALRVEAGERRQDRRVHVDGTPGERSEVRGRKNPHEPGGTDEADPTRSELTHECEVERFPVGEVLGVHEEGFDTRRPRPLQCRRMLPVRDHDDDLRRVVGSRRSVEKRLKIRATSGDEDAHPKAAARSCHATSSTPRSPATTSPSRATFSPDSRRSRAAVSAAAAGTITTWPIPMLKVRNI